MWTLIIIGLKMDSRHLFPRQMLLMTRFSSFLDFYWQFTVLEHLKRKYPLKLYFFHNAIYKIKNSSKNMNYLTLLVHRYVRYGPMLLMSIIYQLTIFQHTIRGPIAPRALTRVNACESYWFMPLLMLENFMRPEQMVIVLFSTF